ncbi:WD40 repeat-like protein [Guyanagaster necrorhizus]|uniref:Pre-rRNA-processing protein IPI3 n=1 Tax=Guyanagaster necrorhizus TaxID=856835 RepID=A0A9P7VNA6_9AGAR|nr:WD40 repeat-like protein [Guyanagaster necrorhizus MCA 3950]KAG7443607.1 WD40 repeat-like protein [Guyanagaster necrorhizus MCA 3950]
MMHFHETIFCATASTSNGPGNVAIHDIQTGTPLASFKQTNASAHCTAFVESGDSQGGFILAAQPDKSLLNMYNFQKDQISLKMVLPEKLSCVAVDRRGEYAAGGTSNGRIYLWEVSSGVLFNSWDAHYRDITVLRFTQDGVALISGSQDSGVSVWSVSRLVDDDFQNELVLPYCTLADHTLSVTDIVCGLGTFPTCRVLTASIDHSVKLWDLSSKSLLTVFQFPKAIACLAWDPTERLFFAASSDGSIYQMNLFRQSKDTVKGRTMEAIGGAGVHDIIRIDDEGPFPSNKRLISVGQDVTCLAISFTGSLLLVGTSVGLIHIYDIASHQLLRAISTHKGFSITYLATMLKPPDLIGHINLTMNFADARDLIPVKPVLPFQRIRDAKIRDMHEVSLILPPRNAEYDDEITFYPLSSFLRDQEFFVKPLGSSNREVDQDAVSLGSRVTNLEAEVVHLREQLGKAKGLNDMMWDTVVQRVIGQPKTKSTPADATYSAESDRPRKRGRTNT